MAHELLYWQDPLPVYGDLTAEEIWELDEEWRTGNLFPFVDAKKRGSRVPGVGQKRIAYYLHRCPEDSRRARVLISENLGMVMFAMNITDVNCLGSLRQTSMALGVERHVILDSVKGYSRIEKDKAYTEYLESVDAKAWYLYLRGVGQIKDSVTIRRIEKEKGWMFSQEVIQARNTYLSRQGLSPNFTIPKTPIPRNDIAQQWMPEREYDEQMKELARIFILQESRAAPYSGKLWLIQQESSAGERLVFALDIWRIASAARWRASSISVSQGKATLLPTVPDIKDYLAKYREEALSRGMLEWRDMQDPAAFPYRWTDRFKGLCLLVASQYMTELIDPRDEDKGITQENWDTVGAGTDIEREIAARLKVHFPSYSLCMRKTEEWDFQAVFLSGGSTMAYTYWVQQSMQQKKEVIQQRVLHGVSRYRTFPKESRPRYATITSKALSWDLKVQEQLQQAPGTPEQEEVISEPHLFFTTMQGTMVYHLPCICFYFDSEWEEASLDSCTKNQGIGQDTGMYSDVLREVRTNMKWCLIEHQILEWEYDEVLDKALTRNGDEMPFITRTEHKHAVPWTMAFHKVRTSVLHTRDARVAQLATEWLRGQHVTTPFLVYVFLWHGKNYQILQYLKGQDVENGWKLLSKLRAWAIAEVKQAYLWQQHGSTRFIGKDEFKRCVFGLTYGRFRAILQSGLAEALDYMNLPVFSQGHHGRPLSQEPNLEIPEQETCDPFSWNLLVPYKDQSDFTETQNLAARVQWFLFRFVIHHAQTNGLFDCTAVFEECKRQVGRFPHAPLATVSVAMEEVLANIVLGRKKPTAREEKGKQLRMLFQQPESKKDLLMAREGNWHTEIMQDKGPVHALLEQSSTAGLADAPQMGMQPFLVYNQGEPSSSTRQQGQPEERVLAEQAQSQQQAQGSMYIQPERYQQPHSQKGYPGEQVQAQWYQSEDGSWRTQDFAPAPPEWKAPSDVQSQDYPRDQIHPVYQETPQAIPEYMADPAGEIRPQEYEVTPQNVPEYMADPVGPRYDALSMEDEVYMGTPNVGLMQPTANKSLDDKEFLALYTKVCSQYPGGRLPAEFRWVNMMQPQEFFKTRVGHELKPMSEHDFKVMRIQYGTLLQVLEEFPNFTATGVYGDAELLSCPGSESRGPGGVVPDYLDTIKRNDEVYDAVQEMRRILIEGTKRDYAELTHGKSGRELERAEAKFRQSYGIIGDDEGSVDIANTPLNFWTQHSPSIVTIELVRHQWGQRGDRQDLLEQLEVQATELGRLQVNPAYEASGFVISKEGNVLDPIQRVSQEGVDLGDPWTWPWVTINRNFTLLQQVLRFTAAQHYATVDAKNTEIAEFYQKMGSSDEKRRLISQGLYVDNVKIVIKDVASTKGFFIKMYRQKEDWSRGRKEVQTIEFRRPGFSKSTAINIVAKNPYYDPVAAKAAKDSMKRQQQGAHTSRGPTLHAPVVDTPVGDDIFDEDYVGYPEEQDLSSVYHDAEEYDPEHGPSTDEDDEVEEMEGYPTPKQPRVRTSYLRTDRGEPQHVAGDPPATTTDGHVYGEHGYPIDKEVFIAVGLVQQASTKQLTVKVTEHQCLRFMLDLPCTIMEAISDVSYDREVKACMTIPRMKGPDDVYSGETRVAILSPDGVVRKKDVLPGGFLTPAFIGKELEKTDMWPAEIVGTRDNRTKLQMQNQVIKDFAGMGNRDYEDVEREVDRQLNERTRLRKKREADIRKTVGMRVDGLRYVVVECMQLLYVDKGEVVGDVRVLSIFETNPTQFECIVATMHRVLSLIVGPPGAGKTMVSCIVSCLLAMLYPRWRQGLVAVQNSATNDVTYKLCNMWMEVKPQFVKAGVITYLIPNESMEYVKVMRFYGRLGMHATKLPESFPQQEAVSDGWYATHQLPFEPRSGHKWVSKREPRVLEILDALRVQAASEKAIVEQSVDPGERGEDENAQVAAGGGLTRDEFRYLFGIYCKQKNKPMYKAFLEQQSPLETGVEEDVPQYVPHYRTETAYEVRMQKEALASRGRGKRGRDDPERHRKAMTNQQVSETLQAQKENWHKEREEGVRKRRDLFKDRKYVQPPVPGRMYQFPQAFKGMVRLGRSETISDIYVRREVGLEEIAHEYFNDPQAYQFATEYDEVMMEYYLDGREASLCKRYLAERVSELKFQIREENRRPTEKEDQLIRNHYEVMSDLDKVVLKAFADIQEHIMKLSTVCIGTAACFGATLQNVQFQIIIEEESSQASDSVCLQPFLRGMKKCIKGGDSKQLGPVVKGGSQITKVIKEVSAFVRYGCMMKSEASSGEFKENPFQSPWLFLDTQYRCQPVCYQASNELFYGGMVKSEAPIYKHEESFPFPQRALKNPTGEGRCLGVLDHQYVQYTQKGNSINCEDEAVLVLYYLAYLVEQGWLQSQISVICLYREQLVLIQRYQQLLDLPERLQDVKIPQDISICTVDQFQGQEDDIVVVCTTRTRKCTPFVNDPRRSNVAWTRSRKGMVIVGDFDILRETAPYWSKICAVAEKHGTICHEQRFLKEYRPPSAPVEQLRAMVGIQQQFDDGVQGPHTAFGDDEMVQFLQKYHQEKHEQREREEIEREAVRQRSDSE